MAAVTWLWNNAWLCVLVLFGGRGEPAGYLIAWLFGVGVLSLAATRRERDLAWLLGGPLLFTLFASALGRYPFGGDGGRLMLFAVPLFVLGAGRGWAVLAVARPLIVYSTLALAIGLPLMKLSVRQARGTPEALRQGDELRTVLQQMREQVRDGDHVYLFDGARPQFYLYMHDFGYLDGRQVTIHEEPRRADGGELRDFEADLARLEGVGRILDGAGERGVPPPYGRRAGGSDGEALRAGDHRHSGQGGRRVSLRLQPAWHRRGRGRPAPLIDVYFFSSVYATWMLFCESVEHQRGRHRERLQEWRLAATDAPRRHDLREPGRLHPIRQHR